MTTSAELEAAYGTRDGVQFGQLPEDGRRWGWYLIVDGVPIYEDGGEPEDQTLARDLWPIVETLRSMAGQRTQLRAERDAAVRRLDALTLPGAERRERIATACLAGILSDARFLKSAEIAQASLECADALIAALDAKAVGT